ncbi:MAG TPA: hypothetical protein VJ851_02590 [Jatrophihabitans sp.]|nr:hypothetical protein [Jatrophihabitans sp.]
MPTGTDSIATASRHGSRPPADSPFGQARLCYDHLAGRLGVGVTRALRDRAALLPGDGAPTRPRAAGSDRFWRLGPNAAELLAELGVDLAALERRTRRPLLRGCLDWTEQQPHLAGALGAALAEAMLAEGWLVKSATDRVVEPTHRGRQLLADRLGVRLGQL